MILEYLIMICFKGTNLIVGWWIICHTSLSKTSPMLLIRVIELLLQIYDLDVVYASFEWS